MSVPLPRAGGALVRRVRDRLARRRLPADAFFEDRHAARQLIATGERALADGRLPEAEAFALRAVEHLPASLDAWRLLGRTLDARGRAEDALDCFGGIVPEDVWEARHGRPRAPAGRAMPLDRTPLDGPERHELPEPAGIVRPPPRVFRHHAVNAAPTFVDRVRRGRAWQDAHNTLVLDSRGHAVADHTLGSERVMRHLADRHEPVQVGARAFLIGARGAGNYYHWTTDILPKLGLCRRAGYRFEKEDRFVLSGRRAGFQLEGLARFGIEEHQVHFTNVASPWVTAEELVVPYLHNTMATTMGSWLPELLKDLYLGEGERPRPTRRIFVSRDTRRAQGRGIENLAEAERCFAERGFEIVYPERLDVAGQARLFAESAVVAGPHGAGLANLVFCAPGTCVLEFYGAHLAPCYRAISAIAGLDYHAHHCLEENGEGDEAVLARSLAARRTAGFPIPPDAARAMMDLAGLD